jgi:HEAT repeat protein
LKDPDPGLRAHAAFVLALRANLFGLEDRYVVEPLISALKDPDPTVRSHAAAALGDTKDPRAIEPLIDALKDRDSGVRLLAASRLGHFKDRRAVGPLVDAVMKDDGNIKRVASEALIEINDPGAVDLLIGALNGTNGDWPSANDWLTSDAVTALSRIDHSRALNILVAGLKDRDAKVRAQAAIGLSVVYDDTVVPPLILALDDPDIAVRYRAAAALGTIRDARAVLPLMAALYRPDHAFRPAVAVALVRIDNPAGINAVVTMFRSGDPRAGSEIYEAIIRVGAKDSEEQLIAALNEYGNEHMAEVFLNSRNDQLADAAGRWAKKNGYDIRAKIGGSSTPGWGSRY